MCHFEMVKLLLQDEAVELRHRDASGKTAYGIATESGCSKIRDLLAEKMQFNERCHGRLLTLK
ncbi:MAG: hypothetical protein P1U40_06835 [Coxiellaceae bacterium]|nr:hypothetical protein [Coxiellaceae bacterium]